MSLGDKIMNILIEFTILIVFAFVYFTMYRILDNLNVPENVIIHLFIVLLTLNTTISIFKRGDQT